MKIYVASSWNNVDQPVVVLTLRGAGHEVYDFRNNPVFEDWSESPRTLDDASEEEQSVAFAEDMKALNWCEAVVLVNPCGISSHMELAHAIGAGKFGYILYPEKKPELMTRMAKYIESLYELVIELEAAEKVLL